METGRFLGFDISEGYGFIEPDGGGSIVLMHTDDVGGGSSIEPGTRLKFSCVQGTGGPKAYNVMVLDSGSSQREPAVRSTMQAAASVPREAIPSVIMTVSPLGYTEEIRDVLISKIPNITTTQIDVVCKKLTKRAARRGWLSLDPPTDSDRPFPV